MLVDRPSQAAHGAWQRYALWLALIAIVLPILALSPHLVSGTELVRLRNAVLLDRSLGADFDWSAPPSADFPFDAPPFDPHFDAVARELKLSELPDDWARALTISRHLLGSAPLRGGGVQDSLQRTHLAIVRRGDGYCADFIDVFLAIASSSGMQARAWAFSFDGFGGHGHILVELWNRDLQRWQLIDLFNNYTFSAGQGTPLSAREFRDTVSREPAALELLPIEPRARVGWIHRDKALDYYRRGLDEWYLFWGSQVQSSERSALYRSLQPVSQAVAEAATMLHGGAPLVRPLATPANAGRIDALHRLRWQLWSSAASAAFGIVLALVIYGTRLRMRRDATPSHAA